MIAETTIKEEETKSDLAETESNKSVALKMKREEADAKQIWIQQKVEVETNQKETGLKQEETRVEQEKIQIHQGETWMTQYIQNREIVEKETIQSKISFEQEATRLKQEEVRIDLWDKEEENADMKIHLEMWQNNLYSWQNSIAADNQRLEVGAFLVILLILCIIILFYIYTLHLIETTRRFQLL